MTSKDPCGVLSELPYSCDTFLRAVIENHRGGSLSVCILLWKKMRVYTV